MMAKHSKEKKPKKPWLLAGLALLLAALSATLVVINTPEDRGPIIGEVHDVYTDEEIGQTLADVNQIGQTALRGASREGRAVSQEDLQDAVAAPGAVDAGLSQEDTLDDSTPRRAGVSVNGISFVLRFEENGVIAEIARPQVQ